MNGCFQFFFASKDKRLPHPDIPTRDVTNTCRAGNKTEPHFEKMMENWCPCRARFVTASVQRALSLQPGSQHYMILTTNHPRTNDPLAVGFLCFSPSLYQQALTRFPRRWNANKYLPYVGSKSSKLVSLADAFRLRPWMTTKEKYLPGKRCGIVYADAYPNLLERILDHFASATDQIDRFLVNVRYLEGILRTDFPERWKDYSNRKSGINYNSWNCSRSEIRQARC